MNKRGRPKKTEVVNNDEQHIEYTHVFVRNKWTKKRYRVNRGGRGSSKSHSIAQILIEFFFTIPDIQILVLRKTLPANRLSCWRLILKLLAEYDLLKYCKVEKGSLDIWYKKANMHFGSVDDPTKIRSTEWHIAWMEETNEFSLDDLITVDTSLRAQITSKFNSKFSHILFCSFNPSISEFSWLKNDFIESEGYGKDLVEIHSTWRHNWTHLTPKYIETLKNLSQIDENYHRIYNLGEWGVLKNIIYDNWKIVPELRDVGETWYGLDFGYNDVTALIEAKVDNREVYLNEKLYQAHLTPTDLIERLKSFIPLDKRKKTIIIGDNSRPEIIEEISRAGFWIEPSVKGPNSVLDGISYLKTFKLFFTEESVNLKKEIKSYSWRETKDKKIIDEPVGFDDHLMDAMRYAIYTRYYKMNQGRPRIRELF